MFFISTADRTCEAGRTKCPSNNICLDRLYLCDGDNDCGDNADENPVFCEKVACKKGWFSILILII